MRTIRFTMFLFYRYYRNNKWDSVPYFSTLCAMAFLLFIHIAALLCWFNEGDLLFGANKNSFIIKFLVLFGISLFMFWKLAPEKQLRAIEYEDHKIKQGGWLLVLYSIAAMAILFLGIIF